MKLKRAIRIASRSLAAARRPEREREGRYLRNADGFDFLPRRLLDLNICLRTLSMRIPSRHRRRRRL